MKQGSLTFVPTGGLANRMRAIASAYTLTQRIGSRLDIIWFKDWALNAPFQSIFMPVSQLNLREATLKDMFLYDRARRKNFFFPFIPQFLLFDRRIKEQSIYFLMKDKFDFELWAKGHKCYMSSYHAITSFPDQLYHKLFRPVKEVTTLVEQFQERFTSHTIGIHIRRTDNSLSVSNSPDQLFIDAVKTEIEENHDTTIFLATDSDEVRKNFIKRFGNRIITTNEQVTRDNLDGIRGGLVDMYTLSKTKRIYGSYSSSFSEMASYIGGNPLIILKK